MPDTSLSTPAAPLPHVSPDGPRSSAPLTLLATVLVIAIVTGTAVAAFLWLLDGATGLRESNPVLLFGLPVSGALVAILYQYTGRGVERGNNLILDEIHSPGGGVPTSLAPLVLAGTLLTHLTGGSAGREGTAVQMGGALASGIERVVLRLRRGRTAWSSGARATLLQAGVAAGFGAVFGTPLAGAVFAIEVLRVGRLTMAAFLPCLMAALLANQVTLAWGIQHTAYPRIAWHTVVWSVPLIAQVLLAAVAFGLAARAFAVGTHALARVMTTVFWHPWLRPAIGGLCVIALTALVGSRDYLGLGVSSSDPSAVTLVSAFRDGGAAAWSWLLKGIFTVVTIGSGFKGGEVTPLFYIGATLGNTIANMLDASTPLFAALGFVAVFAGATNTPLASTLMALELFGAGAAPLALLACVVAVLVSGPTGVYTAQRPRAAPTPLSDGA